MNYAERKRSWARTASGSLLLGALAILSSNAGATITPVPDNEEWTFLTLINEFRAQNGVSALQMSIALVNSSKWMSTDMATKSYFSHTDSLGRDPFTRITAFGYTYGTWGENIAAGNSTAQAALTQWQNACDPDGSGNCTYAHRVNMLNPAYKVIGIGRAFGASSTYQWYWTTDFGGAVDATLTPPNGTPVPTITQQPSNATAPAGQTATFGVTATGATSYQWQSQAFGTSGFSNIAGATSSVYTTPATVAGDNGKQFQCVVTNAGGSMTSNPATLTVNTPVLPAISAFSASPTSVTSGGLSTLSWTTSGATSLSIDQGVGIVTGLTSKNVTPTVTTTYSLLATNASGSATATTTITIIVPSPAAPTITQQPANVTVTVGQTATFTVSATGATSYQWQSKLLGASSFSTIAGATGSSYTTPGTNAGNNGMQFQCLVSNSGGSVSSSVATLTVITPVSLPTVTGFSASPATVSAGASSSLSWTTTGATGLSIDQDIGSVTGLTSKTVNPSVTTTYILSASNSAGTITAQTTITVTPVTNPTGPTITLQPADQTVQPGNPYTFIAAATGVGTLKYHWFQNGGSIRRADQPSYTADAAFLADDGATFYLQVTDDLGTVTTQTATLHVGTTPPAPVAPTITQQPVDQTVSAGNTAPFSVAASGTLPLTYQWYKNSVLINGATGSTYTTPATTLADEGTPFSVVINNAANTPVTSVQATLHVTSTLPPATVATPTISPNGGSFTGSVSVSIACVTSGASIYFTTNGSAPSTGSTLYSDPITLTTNTTIRAVAVKAAMATSAEAAPTSFTVSVSTPTSPIVIQVQPADQTMAVNITGLFLVSATGPGTLLYQWYKNGVAIFRARESSYTYQPQSMTEEGTLFFVVITDGFGDTTTSRNAVLHVTDIPPPATPNISNIDGRTFSPRDSLAVPSYASDTVYNWEISYLGSRVLANGAGSAIDSASAMAPGQTVATLMATTSHLALVDLHLSPGRYAVRVQAMNSAGASGWATGNISVVSAGVSSARVRPNPWKSTSGSDHITFDQMTTNTTVKIFSVSSRLVRTLSAPTGDVAWDLTNDSGDKVASGIYLYLITDTDGNKTKGKLAIIR